jgi:hypothetical protein
VLAESCDEAIGKENDNLKLEVKRVEQKRNILEKQVKTQPSQDNRRNIVNKLEKGKTCLSLLLYNKWGLLIIRRKKESILMKRLNI